MDVIHFTQNLAHQPLVFYPTFEDVLQYLSYVENGTVRIPLLFPTHVLIPFVLYWADTHVLQDVLRENVMTQEQEAQLEEICRILESNDTQSKWSTQREAIQQLRALTLKVFNGKIFDVWVRMITGWV